MGRPRAYIAKTYGNVKLPLLRANEPRPGFPHSLRIKDLS